MLREELTLHSRAELTPFGGHQGASCGLSKESERKKESSLHLGIAAGANAGFSPRQPSSPAPLDDSSLQTNLQTILAEPWIGFACFFLFVAFRQCSCSREGSVRLCWDR